MVTVVIFISGNPVLFSRSFCVTVKTRLDNYLGNLSNVATKDEKVAPISRDAEEGLAPHVGSCCDGVIGGHLTKLSTPQRTSLFPA